MAQPIIEICHVTKVYTLFKNNKEQFLSIFYRSPKLKKHLALDDVTFSVEKGESVGIIGNNGAGKSTILKTITGVTFPTSGQVEVRGRVAALLELTGRGQESPWFAFLNELRRELPVVQKKTYRLPDGTYTKVISDEQRELVQKWRQWSYYKLRYKDVEG